MDMITNPAVYSKYLNYPLQKIYLRSTLNSDGTINNNPHQYDMSSKQNVKKVPNYIKYCIDLIMNDICDQEENSSASLSTNSSNIMKIQNKMYSVNFQHIYHFPFTFTIFHIKFHSLSYLSARQAID